MAIVARKSRYGTRFTAIYRDLDDKQVSAGTYGTRKEAQAAYMGAMAQIKRGIDPKAKPVTVKKPGQGMTVAEFVEQWLPRHRITHNVRVSYSSTLRVHILPEFGEREIGRSTRPTSPGTSTRLMTVSAVRPPSPGSGQFSRP